MDKNNIIGIGLIVVLFFVWVKINTPTPEELEAMALQDSLALVEEQRKLEEVADMSTAAEEAPEVAQPAVSDSVALLMAQSKLGSFAPSGIGQEEIISIENDVMVIDFNTRGITDWIVDRSEV